MNSVGGRLAAVRARVEAACRRAGRDPAGVALVAVSKTMSAATIREAYDAGQARFGENRVQEALEKIDALGPGPEWHLIGHLQRNKARHAVGRFALIHSIDDVDLARELDRRALRLGIVQKVLVQTNLAGEASKHGADAESALPLVEEVLRLDALDLQGLMIIPPPAASPDAARPWFRRLREVRDAAAARTGRELPELSMGMTDDFEAAVEEGATIVRVGRAIFGER